MAATPNRSDDGSPQTIVADREGVITSWGTGCAEMFGYSSDEALGQRVDLIIPPVLHARHWRGFNQAVETGQLKRPGKTLKVPAIHKSGTVLAVEGSLTLEQADDGSVDVITLRLSGEGPGWGPAFWRAVLAVLKAMHAVGSRIRPDASSR